MRFTIANASTPIANYTATQWLTTGSSHIELRACFSGDTPKGAAECAEEDGDLQNGNNQQDLVVRRECTAKFSVDVCHRASSESERDRCQRNPLVRGDFDSCCPLAAEVFLLTKFLFALETLVPCVVACHGPACYRSHGIVASSPSPYSALIPCLLYTSDAADEEDSVDLGGRRIIKKKKKEKIEVWSIIQE
eukprot:TRINITY_DN3171_c0_g1_i1.p1 TRINITY_DN3171_c0_g1~~TRINITY_DN3171_c0_g1_i1.p1  ORF type:complete len:192 (+),score=24.76 TRINITY_DN3171_c0_g1_i1:554-1129(+)